MRARVAAAIVVGLVFAGQAAANDQLAAALKQTGKAVDNMTTAISQAKTDGEAQTIATAVRLALDNGLKQDRPTIQIQASANYCRVTIETAGWKLWSEGRAGKITDHGATVR
jgi:hypothetical protein